MEERNRFIEKINKRIREEDKIGVFAATIASYIFAVMCIMVSKILYPFSTLEIKLISLH